jgi:hypothetical protein
METQRKEKKAGDVVIRGKRIGDYEKWDGDINLYLHNLVSLEGCPKEVKGSFLCGENHLISLKGGPLDVSVNFICSANELISLEFCPKKVGRDFYCNANHLTSLEFCPMGINGIFDCAYNQLTSLKGGPEKVKYDCYCNSNKLVSLEGCPKEIGGMLDLTNNKLKDLHNIHKHMHSCEFINLGENPIESHILGLLKIKNLEKVQLKNKGVETIINKYLPLGDIFACQSELIEAGFEAFAQL